MGPVLRVMGLKCVRLLVVAGKGGTQSDPDWGGPHDPQAEILREIAAQLTFLPTAARSVQGIAAEFARIGAGQGT
jgi:hypothetical protein